MAMIEDYISFAFRVFIHRKMRSWLTVIGILIGIAAVVSLISIGQGMQDSITEQFEMMGIDKIMIMPGGEGRIGMLSAFTAAVPLTEDDRKVIEGVSGVEIAAGMIAKTTSIEFKGDTKYTFVMGLPTDETKKVFEDMEKFRVVEGRNLKETDSYSVIIGADIVDDFFEKDVSIGNRLFINGDEFKVVGIINKIGNRADDSQVYIPIEIAKKIFNEPEELMMVYAQVKSGYEPSDVVEKIKEKLRKEKNEKEGEETFQVSTSEQLMDRVSTVLGVVQIAVIGIAAISIFVSGVGIMNTMYTSVLERAREIGIMKAIGARNSDIMLIFLIESGLIGLIGGMIGVGIGISIGKIVEYLAIEAGMSMLKVSFPIWLIGGALGFSFLAGVLSGVMPAISAARLKPVEALRYE